MQSIHWMLYSKWYYIYSWTEFILNCHFSRYECPISQSPRQYRHCQTLMVFDFLWRILCSMFCDLCGTQYTTLLNLVLIGPRLTILQNTSFMTTSDNMLQMRLAIRNNIPPTRSLYDIRFKSNGSISQFHVCDDLDLDRWPILMIFLNKSNIIPGYLHIKFCNNRPTFSKVMVWYRAADTDIHSQTYIQNQYYNNIVLRDLCSCHNSYKPFI